MDVAVLVGGCSPEHEISLASATQVIKHLDRSRWNVWPVLLERDGTWQPWSRPLVPGEQWTVRGAGSRQPATRPGTALDWLLDEAGCDVVFPVLHGPHGEDGTVQGMLELYGVPFVGSGCAASAAAMDKLRTRQAYAAGGVPMADAFVPQVGADEATLFGDLVDAVGLPAFVKVDVSGSTVGVNRITCEQDLRDFLAEFGGRCRRWFAERAVRGEEITVPVLGNTGSPLQALPAVGIYPVDDDWFTHDAKYRPGATEETVPPRGLSKDQLQEVSRLAERCHELLVCDGMSRTDMIVTEDGPVVLETNTIPGLTTTSLLPQAAAAAGLPFDKLLDRMLELALARRDDARREASRADGRHAAGSVAGQAEA